VLAYLLWIYITELGWELGDDPLDQVVAVLVAGDLDEAGANTTLFAADEVDTTKFEALFDNFWSLLMGVIGGSILTLNS